MVVRVKQSAPGVGTRCGLHIMSHVLKVMPRDIIAQMSSID